MVSAPRRPPPAPLPQIRKPAVWLPYLEERYRLSRAAVWPGNARVSLVFARFWITWAALATGSYPAAFSFAMKSLFTVAMNVLLFGTAQVAVFANALEPEKAQPAAPEALPPGAQIASLEVQPPKVSLEGKYQSAQLVITAR